MDSCFDSLIRNILKDLGLSPIEIDIIMVKIKEAEATFQDISKSGPSLADILNKYVQCSQTQLSDAYNSIVSEVVIMVIVMSVVTFLLILLMVYVLYVKVENFGLWFLGIIVAFVVCLLLIVLRTRSRILYISNLRETKLKKCNDVAYTEVQDFIDRQENAIKAALGKL